MFAITGYPGSSVHHYCHVSSKEEGWGFLAWAEGHYNLRIEERLTQRIISDRDAKKIKYKDGRRAYKTDAELHANGELSESDVRFGVEFV